MKRKQIYILEEQEQALEYLAERRGVPVSLMIREAIAKYIVEQEQEPLLERVEDHPLWGLVGAAGGKDLPADGSLNHDQVI